MAIEVDLEAPAFLIAVPQLGDPNFTRSVVFMLEHGEEGSMGLVLNRASNLNMRGFCDSQSLPCKTNPDQPVFVGGPVQGERAFLLHTPGVEGPETEKVTDDIRLSYSVESLRMLTDDPPDKMRVYMGYAGWGPDQLAGEVAEGAWLVAPASSDIIFGVGHELVWEQTLRRMGIDPVQLMHSGAVH